MYFRTEEVLAYIVGRVLRGLTYVLQAKILVAPIVSYGTRILEHLLEGSDLGFRLCILLLLVRGSGSTRRARDTLHDRQLAQDSSKQERRALPAPSPASCDERRARARERGLTDDAPLNLLNKPDMVGLGRVFPAGASDVMLALSAPATLATQL